MIDLCTVDINAGFSDIIPPHFIEDTTLSFSVCDLRVFADKGDHFIIMRQLRHLYECISARCVRIVDAGILDLVRGCA